MRKGIVLAGGSGTRLYPLTYSVSKQLMPVYDKPMIYYPLSTLMLSGITHILIITTPHDHDSFKNLLGNGSQWGISLEYTIQPSPDGLAQAFVIGEDFIKDHPVTLILGDNIFFGRGLWRQLLNAARLKEGAKAFAYAVREPQHYGVVEFGEDFQILSLEEKPENPRSNYAMPGLYFYDNQVIELAENLAPSPRGELEITDINRIYLEREQLHVQPLGRGVAWLDAGSHETLLQAATFVQTVEERQGFMISCPEEIAYRMNFISRDELQKLGEKLAVNSYGEYLLRLVEEESR